MILSPFIKQRFFDANGLPLAGGKLYSYTAGTTTPLVTYTDQGGGTPNTNPVVLNASGEANVWIDPSLAYKFVLKDSSDVTQWTVDQVSGAGLTGIPQWNANSNYQMGNVIADSSGSGILYVSNTNNNLGNALTSVTNWRILGGNIQTVTANTTLTVTSELVRSNSTSGALTHTLPACSTTPIGKPITIKDVGTGGFTTSVKGSGTDTIDGAVTYSASLIRYEVLTVENNGTTWDVVPSFIGPQSGVITTPKLADGAVTQAKRSALGEQLSSSSSTHNVASASYTDITNLTVTITTTGRAVMVGLIADGGTNPALIYLATSSGTTLNVRFLRDGVAFAYYDLIGNLNGSPQACPNLFTIDTGASAASHVYKLQFISSAGDNAHFQYLKLVAFEL